MTRLMFIAAIAATVAFAGCKTVPTVETVRLIGRAGGTATALVLNQCDIDASAYSVITNIVSNLGGCTPKDGETLQQAWERTAQEHTDIMVAKGTLTPQQGAMVMAGFRLVVKGYDLLLVYYPSIAVYAELTTSAIDGFSEGFLASAKAGPLSNQFKAGIPDSRVYEGLKSSREFLELKK